MGHFFLSLISPWSWMLPPVHVHLTLSKPLKLILFILNLHMGAEKHEKRSVELAHWVDTQEHKISDISQNTKQEPAGESWDGGPNANTQPGWLKMPWCRSRVETDSKGPKLSGSSVIFSHVQFSEACKTKSMHSRLLLISSPVIVKCCGDKTRSRCRKSVQIWTKLNWFSILF